MEKRGQVSLFVIVVLVIIGAIIIVQFMWDRQQTVSKVTDPISAHVVNCIEDKTIEGIEFVSSKGGYYISPEKSLESGIPIYMDSGKDYSPSKKIIEEQISLYVEDNLRECVDFQSFPDYEISEGIVSTSTKINDNMVLLKVSYPLTIKKDEFIEKRENFEAEIDSQLGTLYNVAVNIVQNELEDEYVCIDCLDYFSETYDISVNTLQYDNSTYIFSLIDTKELNDDPDVFTFALDYD